MWLQCQSNHVEMMICEREILCGSLLMQQGKRWSPAKRCNHHWYKHMSIYQKMVKAEKITHVVYVNIYVQVHCVCTMDDSPHLHWNVLLCSQNKRGVSPFAPLTNQKSENDNTTRSQRESKTWSPHTIHALTTTTREDKSFLKHMFLLYWRARTTRERKIECLKKQRGNTQTGTFDSKRLSLPLLLCPLSLMIDWYI